jgi:hypothetical protein
VSAPAPRFDHLAHLSTDDGLFEHALFTTPRREHGYCLDDVARGLVVTSREPEPSDQVRHLTSVYLAFACAAQDDDGRFHNRRREDGTWADEASTDDHWGRAIWGLGTAAAASTDDQVRAVALDRATRALRLRSPWWRAMAYAAIGAFEVLRVRPGEHEALELLTDARALLGSPRREATWPWPEPRLTYANAVLPEALLVIGSGLADEQVLQHGLDVLSWLLDLQVRDGHLSVIPAGGWRRGDPLPAYDQQPIEVAALAEACWRALELTGDATWATGLELCSAWFHGANDTGLRMTDQMHGGGFDGLHARGVNQNQGAESTLAALATQQRARSASVQVPR